MKKIILSIVAVLAFGFANAQIKTDAGTFVKPTSGTQILEINFSPNLTGGDQGVFSLPTVNSELNATGIKYRKFSSDTKALRLSGTLAVGSSGQTNASDGKKQETEFTIAVGAGIEHHMAGAERLSTYWGYEGSIGYVSTAAKDAVGTTAATTKGTQIGFTAKLLSGFDYYIMPKLYLGAEVNYGLGVLNSKPDGGDSVTSFKLAPGITSSFRLGWQW